MRSFVIKLSTIVEKDLILHVSTINIYILFLQNAFNTYQVTTEVKQIKQQKKQGKTYIFLCIYILLLLLARGGGAG